MAVRKGHKHKFELAWRHKCWEWGGEGYRLRTVEVHLCACGEPGYPVPVDDLEEAS